MFYVHPPNTLGVTFLWNMAYRYWKRHGYSYLFISNNDVLVPDGVINRLVQVGRNELGGTASRRRRDGMLSRRDGTRMKWGVP